MNLRLVTDNTEDRELESWFAASIANYVADYKERPYGAIMVLFDECGSTCLVHLNTTRNDLAMGGAILIREATEE